MLKDLKVSKLPMVRWPSAFCLLLWPILCWGSPALAATLESQAGQMIMCGFRGLQIEPEAPILKDLQAGLCDMIMTGHLVHQGLDPVFPATLSRAILRDLLREELEFKGVIVSDDLQMKSIRNEFSLSRAILHSVRAGVDILLFGNNLEYDPHIARTAHSILVRLVKEGVIARARIQASWTRIQALKKRLARP